MPEFRFENITVTVIADTAKEAYDKVCNALHLTEFTTDSFTEFDDQGKPVGERYRDTTECWPEEEDEVRADA